MFLSEHTNNKLYSEVMVTPLSEAISVNNIYWSTIEFEKSLDEEDD